MRGAYADPPYMDCSDLYRGHPDYAGEVDHKTLIERLMTYDCWALSASMKSLRTVLALCPPDVFVLAWVKPIAPPMGDKRMYSWEPVITWGGRPTSPTRTHCVASPPMFTFRETPEGHVIGEKPEAFCHWVFRSLGLTPADTLDDLFPGSGAVGRAWATYDAEPTGPEPGLLRWLAGSPAKISRPSLAEVEAAGYRLVQHSEPNPVASCGATATEGDQTDG